MVYAFDTLAYSKRLREKGIPQEQAEAHAEAIREFVMADLATKADIHALEAKMDALPLLITVRLGFIVAAGVGILAALIKLSFGACDSLRGDSQVYLRHSTVRKDGKTHTYWRLVRSLRRGRKVTHETVAHLGELDAQGRARARGLGP